MAAVNGVGKERKKRKRANEEKMAPCVLLPFLGVPRRLHFLLLPKKNL